jgi:hypothetical protein
VSGLGPSPHGGRSQVQAHDSRIPHLHIVRQIPVNTPHHRMATSDPVASQSPPPETRPRTT